MQPFCILILISETKNLKLFYVEFNKLKTLTKIAFYCTVKMSSVSPVFYTEVNSEYWSQKCAKNGNIHSIELDVHAEKQSVSNLSFILSQLKQGRKYYALASSPSQLVRTGMIPLLPSPLQCSS